MKGQRHLVLSLLTSTAGGILGWFVYLQALKFTASALSGTMVETGRVGSLFLQVFVTALAVFVAFGLLIAALSRHRWLMHWPHCTCRCSPFIANRASEKSPNVRRCTSGETRTTVNCHTLGCSLVQGAVREFNRE